MDSSAEVLSRIVDALAKGRGVDVYNKTELPKVANLPTVIDATAFAKSQSDIITKGQAIDLAELEDVRPPFDFVAIGFSLVHIFGEDSFRTAYSLSVPEDVEEYEPSDDFGYVVLIRHHPDNPDWQIAMALMTGLSSKLIPTSVVGPTSQWWCKLSEDGQVTKIATSSNLDGLAPEEDGYNDTEGYIFHMALMCLNMANCANIEIVEPIRPRAERRRINRMSSVAITNLMIRTKGTRSASRAVQDQSENTLPLHTVRGHVAHYGACCPWHEPRGKLFGKYDRKVWVPAYAKGSEENGVREHRYTVEPVSDGS